MGNCNAINQILTNMKFELLKVHKTSWKYRQFKPSHIFEFEKINKTKVFLFENVILGSCCCFYCSSGEYKKIILIPTFTPMAIETSPQTPLKRLRTTPTIYAILKEASIRDLLSPSP